jgi:Envelope integrity protein A
MLQRNNIIAKVAVRSRRVRSRNFPLRDAHLGVQPMPPDPQGGFGMTALTANNTVVVPIRSGLGLRSGASFGYLKFTPQSTWNPF